jgi:hypothetical protein
MAEEKSAGQERFETMTDAAVRRYAATVYDRNLIIAKKLRELAAELENS